MREVNASECWKKKPTGKSGGVVRRAVGGCEGRSDKWCCMVRKKEAWSRSPLLLGGSNLTLSSRRWSDLCLIGC